MGTSSIDTIQDFYEKLPRLGIVASDVLAVRHSNELALSSHLADIESTITLLDSLPQNEFWQRPKNIDQLVSSAEVTRNVIELAEHRSEVYELFQELITRGHHITDEEKKYWHHGHPVINLAESIVDVATTDARKVVNLCDALKNIGLSPFFYDQNTGIFAKLPHVRLFMDHQEEIIPLLRGLQPFYQKSSGRSSDNTFDSHSERPWIYDLFGYTPALIALSQKSEDVVTLQQKMRDEVGAAIGYQTLFSIKENDSAPRIMVYLDRIDDVVKMYTTIKENYPHTTLNGHPNSDDYCYGQFMLGYPERIALALDDPVAFQQVMQGIRSIGGWGRFDAFNSMVNHPAFPYVMAHSETFAEDCRRAPKDYTSYDRSDEFKEFPHVKQGSRGKDLFAKYVPVQKTG